jgi:hypothetical protein
MVNHIIFSYYRIFNQSILSKKTFFLNELESQFDRFLNIYPSIPLINSYPSRHYAVYIVKKI